MKRLLVCCVVIALAAVCGACGAAPDQSGKVEISVMGLPQPVDANGRKWFLATAAAFERENPAIKIRPTDAQWDARTFAAKLAAGNAETLVRVPLTEPATLIARRQVADITAEATALPAWSAFDPKVLAPVTKAGRVYGLPENMYALGLIYNRKLFTQAGLDPDRPPTTWAELRTAAKQLTQRTGAIGFGALTTKNGGGWHLSAMTYSFGGTMQTSTGGQPVAAFDAPATTQALQLLKDMRWTDESMGTQQLRSQDDMGKDFAAGRVAMAISAPDYYFAYAQNLTGDPTAFGMAALPQGGGNATLVGGTIDMVNARATAQQRQAAVKWANHLYLKVASDPQAAVAYNKTRKTDGLAVGVPVLPLFDKATQDKVTAAITPYVNVPEAGFRPFLARTTTFAYQPEPAAEAQALYGILDSTVQAVLTQQDANVPGLLASAQGRVNSLLKQKRS